MENLGIDTSSTPRVGQDGEPLERYSPLGGHFIDSAPAEVLLVGIPHETSSGPDVVWLEDARLASPQPLSRLASEEAAFVNESTPSTDGYASKRAFAVGDLDADGRMETVAAYLSGKELRLAVYEDTSKISDPAQSPSSSTLTVGSFAGAQSLAVTTADVDGDTRDDVVVGYTTAAGAFLMVLRDDGNGFLVDPAGYRELPASVPGAQPSLILASGNYDQDDGEEYVAVLNEWMGAGSLASTVVVDDQPSGYALIAEGGLTVSEQDPLVASACFADLDADGLDELVYGGLRFLGDDACNGAGYQFSVFDDVANGRSTLDTGFWVANWANCQGVGYEVEFVHTVAMDLDGDGREEVALNQWIWELSSFGAPDLVPKRDHAGDFLQVPEDAFFRDQNAGVLTRATSAMAAGDLTGDGLDDILVFHQGFNADVRVFAPALVQDMGIELQEQGGIETAFDSGGIDIGRNPIVICTDTDDDGVTLVRTPAEHQLVFTEPVVLAVLASPPTVAGISQNYDASVTTFGNTESQGDASDRSLTTEASVSLGVEVDGGPLPIGGFSFSASLQQAATRSMGTSYTLSQTIEYTTGPLEDTVIFTCIPMDRYTYRVVRHFEPDQLGALVTVDLPRRPVTLQVERSYFNANLLPGSPVIDESVLAHTIGDPTTYPSYAEGASIVNEEGGLQSDPITVGQGAGAAAVTLAVEVGSEYANTVETGYSFDMEVTAGTTTVGTSVGNSVSSTLTTTFGDETTYSGSIGNILGDEFTANTYSFRLFTYYHQDPVSGQKFQVLNYMVAP